MKKQLEMTHRMGYYRDPIVILSIPVFPLPGISIIFSRNDRRES